MADPDISGMPDPSTIGLAPQDPTNGMPDPKALFKAHHGYEAQSDEDVAEFMRNPDATPDVRKEHSARYGASLLTGIPRAAAGVALAVPAAVAGGAGALTGAVGAAFDPAHAGQDLETGRERLRSWSAGVNNLANYVPATKAGAELSGRVLGLPGEAGKSVNENLVRPVLGENAAQAVGDIAQDVGTVLPAAGLPAFARAGAKGVSAAARAFRSPEIPEGTTYDASGNAIPPTHALTPPVGTPITEDTLRNQPNPIPPPDGTVAAVKSARAAPATPPTAPAEPTKPTMTPVPGQEPAAQPATTEAVGTPSPGGAERGSVRRFNPPAKEGPQGQSNISPDERTGHLDRLDALSGGGLPTRRTSAVTGDYNATANDFQMKEANEPQMVNQLKTETAALHKGAETVHQSVGSEFDNSVSRQTLEDRGRTVREGALQGIENWFEKATNGMYQTARETHGDNPLPNFLSRADQFLKDDANYMPDSFRRSAQARLEQLKTRGDNGKIGDGSDAAQPASVGAAERFREWLNQNRTLDNAHVIKQLKDHTDMDVAEQGGPGLFQTARNLRTHQAKMMEEPTLMKQLLSASDSQGINHQVPTHQVMDKIADAPTEQAEHLMKVLHAGAHLGDGELAGASVAAIREIQAHMVSRMHAAATDADGSWNARKFHNAADKYSTKMPSVFKDRPDVVSNLKTLNDAGNTLHMDKHYPGAFGQESRTGALGHAAEMAGNLGASIAHEIPVAGRYIGRAIERGVERATGKMNETSRAKEVAKRIVDRNGKQLGAVGEQPAGNRPLGAVIGGGRERGATGDLGQNERPTPPVKLSASPQGVTAKSENGSTSGIWRGNDLHIKSTDTARDARGQGEGNARLVTLADHAHDRGGKMHSGDEVSEPEQRRYTGPNGLAAQGYDVKTNPHTTDPGTGVKKSASELKGVYEVGPKKSDVLLNTGQTGPGFATTMKNWGKQRGSVKVMNEETPPPSEENGSQLNVGLHQGQEGQPGFRKMSKQQAQAAVESTGAKVTRNTVLTPERHGVSEPTAVMSTDRPLSHEEMQSVLAKTKQSAIPQRANNGDESMHIAPGHEEIAKKEGWDSFNPDYFREHDGRTMTDAAANPKNIHPDTTVREPKRSAFAGVYDDPKEIMKRLGEPKAESPHMEDIFGVNRKDLHDSAVARGDVEPKTPIPGIAPKGKGSAHANNVTTPENAERIRNIIQAYKEHDPSGYHGMVGWYEMDPMYHSIKKILGGNEELAGKVYHNLNSYTSYASPMSSVGPEISRGTAAATLASEGKFAQFEKHGGKPNEKAPAALKAKNFELGNEGHAMHSTAHAGAMSRFNETGEEARAVKTGTYRRSGDAPSRSESDYQNTVPVGDSHWSRGVGLADVRGSKAFDGSAEGPEMKVLAPWYHENVARHPDINLPSTSAQAVQWGALSKETRVESPIGAPKLEIWADKIAEAAKREGVKPKEMWERIVKRLAK